MGVGMSWSVGEFVFEAEDESRAFADWTSRLGLSCSPVEIPGRAVTHIFLDDAQAVGQVGGRLLRLDEAACSECGGRGWHEVRREVEPCPCGACGSWREAAGRFVLGLQKGDRRAVRLAAHLVKVHTVDS
ncbi:MAG: hypothetical protein ACI88C_000003 [Acidimicrobiales bacterium]|jgi:hypothetical protein